MVLSLINRPHFLLAADSRIKLGLLAAVSSICETLPKFPTAKITVMDGGLPEDIKRRLQVVSAASSHEIELIPFKWPDGYDAPALEGSRLTYARLCAGEIIPADFCIYIDSDIVVTHDLSPLFEQARSEPEVPLWAARNRPDDSFRRQLQPQNGELVEGVAENEPYFNAGLLVINLARWRELNIARVGFELASRYQFLSHDQDALNVVFKGQWRELPDRWNYQLIDRTTFPEDITVLHYSGRNKPWHYGYNRDSASPFRHALAVAGENEWTPAPNFQQWVRNSPWRPFFSRMLYRLRRMCGLSGIRHR